MTNLNNVSNKVFLTGEIVLQPTYSHEMFGEGFFESAISVKRLSGQTDVLPITISERLIAEKDIKLGDNVTLYGQFRSYNKICEGKSRLMLTVFVREILDYDPDSNPNAIELIGFICKPTVYRTTPFNREICDLLIAVNRAYNKSDYIPCIAWGRNARFVKYLTVGEQVTVFGRIQSREYQKKISDDQFVTKTAFEVSVSRIVVGDKVTELVEQTYNEQDYDENLAI
ncbi:MAG: single-stranded DNA-binding protein [Clostridia bacterium]|nr:single-stranded DNA-binding protein [Clostridia bacterium]